MTAITSLMSNNNAPDTGKPINVRIKGMAIIATIATNTVMRTLIQKADVNILLSLIIFQRS